MYMAGVIHFVVSDISGEIFKITICTILNLEFFPVIFFLLVAQYDHYLWHNVTISTRSHSTSWSTLDMICFFNFSQYNRCIVATYCGINLQFLITNDVENLHVPISNHVYSLVKHLFISLLTYLLGGFFSYY